jgi:phage tail sheath protein FI
MAERMISPGVFTTERDLSFLPQGIAEIGAAFVGPTVKGPAFRPVVVQSRQEFADMFGEQTPDFYTAYAIDEYLKEAGSATVVRILGLGGYDPLTTRGHVIRATSASVTSVLGFLHPTRTGVSIDSASVSGSTDNFVLTLTSSAGTATQYTSLSFDSTSPNYIAHVLGTSAVSAQIGYAYAVFPSGRARTPSGSVSIALGNAELNLSGSVYGTYSNASTPWIRSQLVSNTRYNLFKLWTLSDGTYSNTDVKVSITGIRPAASSTEYGTFSVSIRKFDDTDARTVVLEQFDNLTLDPTSPNYIGRRIGTSRMIQDANGDVYMDGDFPNNSRYVYAEMSNGIEEIPVAALPLGFAPLSTPLNSANVPAPAYVTSRYYTPAGSSTAVSNDKTYYGFDFSDLSGASYLAPLPSGSAGDVGVKSNGSADTGFDLLTTVDGTDQTDVVLTNTLATGYRKFTVPFQGGFDGQNPAVVRNTGASITSTNTMGFDLSDTTKAGTKAYIAAFNALSNPDAIDINMLVTPGVVYSQHPYVVTKGVSLCETRGDAFYIFDADVLGATVDSVVNAVSGLESTYAATYHPWIKVLDPSNNKLVWVPPSVVLPGVFAFNDSVAAEWYAPAGLNRGGIGSAIQARSRLARTDMDDLYQGRVNPIATFPGQGVSVWGQKTLQKEASALDRINVRRLLIAVKKFIASTTRYLVFEQNVESTRKRFLSIVNPYLSSVAERNGLYSFRVKMDDTNNTSDVIDRSMLVGELYLKPAKSVEEIALTFNILSTGAIFPE